jgi:Ca-activated chloride channel family protein
MLEHFHFIRPMWLLALLPLALLAWYAFRPANGGNAWRRVVDARLLPLMMATGARGVSWSAASLVLIGWMLATFALADPTWDLKPQPVFQTNAARVVVLDLSSSMNDADLKPSRLVRARYKIEDVLAQAAEGQTALVAYAGDAFTVAPLTRDANTIRSLLKVLEPDLMPADGSRADLGLSKAGELLHQAGVATGQILLIADGVDPGKSADTARAAARLKSEGYTVSVLGVGTQDPLPLTDEKGRLVRTDTGGVQVPKLDVAALESVARAGGGRYQAITDGGEGLQSLLQAGAVRAQASAGQTQAMAPAWKERGPFIAVLLLPLAALAFRRNWLVSAALLAALAVPSQAAMAATWADAWQRPDQQASKALAAGDYAKAAAVSPDDARRGSAEYKRGNYQLALEDFSRATGADADYNRGNALARLGRYQDAVTAYDKAIGESPSNDDAKANKAAVEALLKQKPPPSKSQRQQQSASAKDGSKPNSGNQSGGQGGSQQGPAKPNPGGQAKSSQGSSGPGQSEGSKEGESGGKTSTPKRDAQSRSSASNAGKDGHATSASGPSAAQPAGNDFAQAAQQVGKSADGKTGEPDEHSPRQPATSHAGNERPESGAASAPASNANAQPIEGEEKLAAEQWLRRIPDDPGGLLRRKFLYQYRQRARQADSGDE